VARLTRRIRQEAAITGEELTASTQGALASIERLGPITLGELSTAERVKPPTMTKIVACLEELGLVSRTVDQSDRRVARVEATASGLAFLEDSRQQKDAYLAQRLRGVSDEDRMVLEQAAGVLERILDE
jgi:DNA-binding MarR family transcriptional regulator